MGSGRKKLDGDMIFFGSMMNTCAKESDTAE
jgi:hypothetical protein